MENLHVKFEGEGNTFTLLQGKALDPKHPEKINISGDIKTGSNFLTVRRSSGSGLQTIDKSIAVVTVDKKALYIQLQLDPENHFGATITGKLEKSDELLQFHINEVHTFTKEQLVKLLKFSKLYFANADKHAEMLLAFQKVSSTVNYSSKAGNDDRGNVDREFVKNVTTNAPTEFILTIPIFKNFPPSTFRVDVCLDVTEGGARFWFESVELHEIMIKQTDEIFADELKSCEGFVIVNK